MSKRKKKKKPKAISAEEFDRKFDDGEDITEYLDMSTAKMCPPVNVIHRVNIDIPSKILKKVDKEAGRVGVPRTSIIKIWIAERVDKLAG